MVLVLLIILAVLIWMIQHELEPEKQADELSEVACSACRRSVDSEMMVCPHCQQLLREACPHCRKGKLISHHFCPFCGETQEVLK